MCSLDYLLEITAINDILLNVDKLSKDRADNKVQAVEKAIQLALVENSVLDWSLSRRNGSFTDRRMDLRKARLGWASDMWGAHFLELKFSLVIVDFSEDLSIEVVHPNGARNVITSSDYPSFLVLIGDLRSQPDRHIRLTGSILVLLFQNYDTSRLTTDNYIIHTYFIIVIACIRIDR